MVSLQKDNTQFQDISFGGARPGSFKSMLGLFGRAAIKSDFYNIDQSVTPLRCTLDNVHIDVNHLKAYKALLGFKRHELLPATYLNMLAFPLVLKIMTDPRFPMKAMGQVHLSNHVSVHKCFSLTNALRLSTSVVGTEITSSGVEWTLEMTAEIDGELVWSSVSTMLHRCNTGMPRGPAIEVFRSENPVRWSLDEGLGRRYAKVSGDFNPIHLSATSARLFGFKSAIAHGMWSKARCLAALEDELPDQGYAVAANFRKPLFLPSEVLFHRAAQDSKTLFSLFNGAGQLAHLDGFITEDIDNA